MISRRIEELITDSLRQLCERSGDMKKIIITVGSVTYAIKLKRILAKAKIISRLVKVSQGDLSGGCIHGVELSERDFYQAVVIMRDNNISYSVYNDKQ